MPKCYLAGSIQDAKDSGVKWREKLTPKLVELGWTVLDPVKSESNLADGTIDDAKKVMDGWLASGNREKFQHHMRLVKADDLRMVDESDLVIVYLNWKYAHGGTFHELGHAWERHIPIYAMSYEPLKDFNQWILSLVWDGGKLFESWSQLLEGVERWQKRHT